MLVNDESGQVRQAATFLNQTLKTIVNDTTFNEKIFSLKHFVELLSEKLQSGASITKEFMLDWLMTLEEIPQFELSFDLPVFLRQIF